MNSINIEFWLGQVFTLVATIVGVYLAANSGFEKAIEFESLQSKRSAYFVNRALYNELSANLEEIDAWVEEFNKDPMHNAMDMRAESYQLDTFLWETMQEGSSIFEVPYQQVKVISGFYGSVEHLRGVMLSGNPFEAPKAAKSLASLTSGLKNDFMPTFKNLLEVNEAHLAKRGIQFD
ncbi:Uncharacterised protein [BD1-7 clade bacterium]|uniref:Uncharacterized protein n=1 Tax=BD1-7 clade bacterium TaxID=2029982 RepID=A0A5S9Q7T6_9GAMM|nr:Uncharacterised protein [BD1-7 clade bacterium]CAA0113928.1 Uncharacterised protein [BD1-7 clade bacterium]